ncbi:hypothetical protein AX16_004904 [Volvariella volvacea WC 439]|nr:hypothetical protein AX16_004904 [Volvariella volvacea WC 439]
MFYKLGLEIFNGSMLTMAADRFGGRASALTGAASGVNLAAQSLGAILIAPLVMKWPTRIVLSTAILFFAIMATLLLIIDAATGGCIKYKPDEECTHNKQSDSHAYYGSWSANLATGVAYGMVELIRRIIPAEVVGDDVGKLRRMDAMVHIFYEITGTFGAFAGVGAIDKFGNNYSLFLPPVFFTAAAVSWFFLGDLGFRERQASIPESEKLSNSSSNYLVMVYRGFMSLVQSIAYGGSLVLGSLHFLWLLPSYSLAFYLHRYLEDGLAVSFADRVLGISSWRQIIIGGSNLGELFGALLVFVLSDHITTPLPWLRLDAVTLNIAWVLYAFSGIVRPNGLRPDNVPVLWAWRTAACFFPMSLGWAAGDVSLSAYIQSHLPTNEASNGRGISALGSIVAFLYVAFIALYATLGAGLGEIVDNYAKGHDDDITEPLKGVAGIQYSVCYGIIFIATFVPAGSWTWNPKAIGAASIVSVDEKDEENPGRRTALTVPTNEEDEEAPRRRYVS